MRRKDAVIRGLIICSIFAVLTTSSLFAAMESGEPEGDYPGAEALSQTFVDLANRVTDSVVNIHVVKVIHGGMEYQSPFGPNDPFREFFERFMGPKGDFRQQGQGSGFIIDSEGYVVTNNHVVENADKITVKFSNGVEAEAEVVGTDPNTDIALLKLPEEGSYPNIPLGDSGELRVGEWVIAIGNPFGLEHTVTAGIVSAKGRVLGAARYEDYIQTDASINPGNSGGPLINLRGEVVGVNTLINASGQGIGFAIPINLARSIFTQLKQTGKVVRGWLGIRMQHMNEDLARSLELESAQGVLVNMVVDNSPAQKAGLEIGDVIVEYDGKQVKDAMDLSFMVAETKAGERVSIKVWRKGKELTFKVRIAERIEEEASSKGGPEGRFELGLSLQNITPELAQKLGLRDSGGVLVSGVMPGSPASEADLRRGDVIKEVNQAPVDSVKQFRDLVSEAESDEAILLLVVRGDGTFFTTVKKP